MKKINANWRIEWFWANFEIGVGYEYRIIAHNLHLYLGFLHIWVSLY